MYTVPILIFLSNILQTFLISIRLNLRVLCTVISRGLILAIQTLTDIIEKRQQGVVYLNRVGRIISINSFARDHVQQNACLSINQKALTTRRPEDQANLELAIQCAIDKRKSTTLFVRRDDSPHPLRFDIQPISGRQNSESENEPAAILIINGVDQKPTLLTSHLGLHYILTDAEMRLCESIFNSLSLAQHAKKHDIKITTVRWTLSNVFSKTQTSSQRELYELMLSFSE